MCVVVIGGRWLCLVVLSCGWVRFDSDMFSLQMILSDSTLAIITQKNGVRTHSEDVQNPANLTPEIA